MRAGCALLVVCDLLAGSARRAPADDAAASAPGGTGGAPGQAPGSPAASAPPDDESTRSIAPDAEEGAHDPYEAAETDDDAGAEAVVVSLGVASVFFSPAPAADFSVATAFFLASEG